MHLDLSSALAFLNLQPWSISIIIPVAGLLFAGVIIVTAMYFSHRRQELWHQTARLALEKGQPLPPAPEGVHFNVAANSASANQPRWRGYLIGGLINIGVGLGLFFALAQIPGTNFNLGYFGCIPGFIGLALLLGAAIEGFAARK